MLYIYIYVKYTIRTVHRYSCSKLVLILLDFLLLKIVKIDVFVTFEI